MQPSFHRPVSPEAEKGEEQARFRQKIRRTQEPFKCVAGGASRGVPVSTSLMLGKGLGVGGGGKTKGTGRQSASIWSHLLVE